MHRIFLFIISLFAYSTASLLAIDYGAEWIKASVIKPGVPFDVLLNRDSKRKIQSSIAWKGEDRLFGGDAFSLTSRFPADSFNGLKLLLGRPFKDDAWVELYSSINQNNMMETPRGTVAFQRSPMKTKGEVTEKDSDRQYTTEELIAMQFSYIKDLADSVSAKTTDKVKDVVLTVPPFFTQQERQALEDAIDIAGLKLLALVHDGTAVAVNYAVTRNFPEKEWHVIYDAGSSSVTATVLSFASTTNGKGSNAKTNGTDIVVGATAFDRTIGGMELDKRMRDILIDDFNRKFQSKNVDIRTDGRGMAKLWKEAARVRTVLSANGEAAANVESIAFDLDYKSRISRQKFEDACSDISNKFAEPILQAVAKAGLTMDDISSVILAGGLTRTPMIQAALKKAVGEKKLASNVNADEAAVLGAALYGATISRQVKTKEIRVTDVFPWDVVVGYPAGTDGTRVINTVVFPSNSQLGTKKTLTLKRQTDFTAKIGYKNSELARNPNFASIEVTEVAEAFGNMTERLKGIGEPVIKLTVEMDREGFVTIPEAIVWGDVKDDSIAGKLKGFFGGSSNKTDDDDSSMDSETATITTQESVAASSSAATDSSNGSNSESSSSSSSTSSGTSSTSTTAKPEKTLSAKERSSIKLPTEVTYLGIRPLTREEKRSSRTRLTNIDAAEVLKRRKEEARNNLEAYLYRLRDLLEGDSKSVFFNCSTTDERKKIEEKLSAAFDWMYEHADDASTGELWEKRDSLESMEKPIQFRYSEMQTLPGAISDLQQAHWASRTFLQSAADNATEEAEAGLEPKYTTKELEDFERKLRESEAWLNDGAEKQKLLEKCSDGDPVLLTAELNARGTALQRDAMRLLRRKTPRRKASTTTTATTTTGTSTDTSKADATGKETTTIPSASSASSEQKYHTRDEL